MFRFQVLDQEAIPWKQLDSFQDRTIHQTQAWLEFLKASQGVKPLVIEIKQGGQVVGYFTGGLFKTFGIRILGSSFPGWMTPHMGFNLLPDISRSLVAQELIKFAFTTLKCWHIEIYDKYLRFEDIQEAFPQARYWAAPGWVVDMSGSEKTVFNQMNKARRRYIKAATQQGLLVEQAFEESFVDDYYAQLEDVFKHRGLAPTYSKERVRLMIRILNPTGRLLLVRVREPETGLCIGSGLFLGFNGTMHAWGAAAFRAKQHYHPNESLHWFAMRYWHERGMKNYDMVGGGNYKRQYGAKYIETHWIRISRLGVLMTLRDQAQGLIGLIQKLRGKFAKYPSEFEGV